MSDLESEMEKYASLIKNECATIANTFQKLSELYKQMNEYLKKKRKFSEEYEKDNLDNNIKNEEERFEKKRKKKEVKNKEIKENSENENKTEKNIQKKNDETILKRGLIKAKILIQPKYDAIEGKMINGFQILVIFGDYEYNFGPYKSNSFANDLKNIILNKLDQVSNKWGNCRKLNQEQQDSLFNCFKEIEKAVDEFFIKNDNRNNNDNINNLNNNNINNNNNNKEIIDNNNKEENIDKNNKKKKIISDGEEEIKKDNNSFILNKYPKLEGNKDEKQNDLKSEINEKESLEKSFSKNNISKNSLKENKEKTSPLTPLKINAQLNNDKKDKNPEKTIKKELNILHYLTEEDYENEKKINK